MAGGRQPAKTLCSVIGVTVLEITVLPVPVNVYQVKDLVDYGI